MDKPRHLYENGILPKVHGHESIDIQISRGGRKTGPLVQDRQLSDRSRETDLGDSVSFPRLVPGNLDGITPAL